MENKTEKIRYLLDILSFKIHDIPEMSVVLRFGIILNIIVVHLLLFITRKYTIINANLKLINAKINSFYSMDIHQRRYATICTKGHSIAPTDDH